MKSKTHRVSNVPLFLALSAGLVMPAFVVAAPVDKVKLKVWLTSVSIKDDMDDRLTRGCGDLAIAYNVGVSGQPSTGNSAGAVGKNTDGKPLNICDNSTLGINQLILDKDLCCPLPDLELVIDLWDDDDSTADMLAKISSTVAGAAAGVILGADGKPIADALEAVRKALELEGKPTSDSMGTVVDLNAHPPGVCIFCTALTTDHEVKLAGGTGANNGSIKLSWKSCKIGTCEPIGCDSGGPPPTPPDDNIQEARAGQSSDDEIDLHIQVGDDVLQVPMLAGDTRDFYFGIDTDLNVATGVPASSPLNALAGCEKRVVIHQSSDGSSNTSVASVEVWDSIMGWTASPIPVLSHAVRGREVLVYVSKSALGLGSSFGVMMQLNRNGVPRDVEPNDQLNQRPFLMWLPQGPGIGEPPYVVRMAQIEDVPQPQYHLRYTFNEIVTVGATPIQLSPAVSFPNVVRSFRTLDVIFQVPPNFPSEQVITLTLDPAQISDAAGNHLDGNLDGIAGDLDIRKFDPPERRVSLTNSNGIPKNEFFPGETIYAVGSSIPVSGVLPVYLIADGSALPGQPLHDRTCDHQPAFVSVVGGSFSIAAIGTPCDEGAGIDGNYAELDVVIDVNSNGIYDLGQDVLGKGEGIGANVGRFLDCNNNGIADQVDILLGTSQDSDADGIPDECTVCRGDLNFDGAVEDADFVVFAKAYNMLLCADDLMPPHCQSDLNRDGAVDDDDFVIFVHNYNELICP